MEGDLMRKTLKVVAIVALALLVAAPAMALDFKFGAEYRVRMYSNTNGQQANLGRGELPGVTPRGVQIRVRPRFDASDDNGNITATLRLEIGDIEWGNGGGPSGAANGVSVAPSSARIGPGTGGAMGADGVNVETKWAYIDFMSPFGIPLRWRAGLQPWFESKGLIIDDDVAGIRAYGKTGIASYEIGWYRASGGPCTNTALPTTSPFPGNVACSTSNTLDNNYDFYEAKVGLAVAKWLNPTVYYIYGDNRAATTPDTKPISANFVGARLDGNFNIFRYDVDFVYGTANGGPNGNFAPGGSRAKTTGWAVDAGLHFPIGPALLHVVGSYGTGDKQNGGKSEAMPYIAPSWNGAGGLYEIIGSGGAFDQVDVTQDYPAGLWMLGAGVEYRPVKALWLRGMYGFAGFSGSLANCAGAAAGTCFGPTYSELQGKSTLGHEISFRADWDVWTGFKVQGTVGWLIPSKGDTAGEYVLQLYYNF
jgi:hypothetical protein